MGALGRKEGSFSGGMGPIFIFRSLISKGEVPSSTKSLPNTPWPNFFGSLLKDLFLACDDFLMCTGISRMISIAFAIPDLDRRISGRTGISFINNTALLISISLRMGQY